MPKGSDEGLHTKVHTAYGKVPHPAYKRGSTRLRLGFTLVHYAGEVVYDMAGFLEKNKDRGPVDAIPLLRNSSCALLRVAFAPTKAEQAAMSAKKGARFSGVVAKLSQLAEPTKHLKASSLHFIRCFNRMQRYGQQFEHDRVAAQLRCNGVLQTCLCEGRFPRSTPCARARTVHMYQDFNTSKQADAAEDSAIGRPDAGSEPDAASAQS